jgi:hypothetical protein
MTTYTHNTTTGHRIDVNCWRGSIYQNFSVAIGGVPYTDGSSIIGPGENEETEAKHQAESTAADIESGRLRWIANEWRLVEDEEIERGISLAAALATDVGRDEWQDSGAPEKATEPSSWSFDGWNAVRDHLKLYGWVMLGGDLYALPWEATHAR